jgi:hypothetical protein
MKPGYSVWVGFDPRETDAFAVARHSALRNTFKPLQVKGVVLINLRTGGLYNRPTSRQGGRLWDDISNAPMATEFACSRFLVPHLAKTGWALFMDSDMLVRDDLFNLFSLADDSKAVMVVKHNHQPPDGSIKMDGQLQTLYARKNWSSVMLFNCGHLANRALTLNVLNTWTGRELHAFGWLRDDQIGELPARWNHLVGVNPPDANPAIVHYTLATPDIDGHEHDPFADEWFRAARVAGYQNPVGFHTEIQGLGLGG